MMTHKDAALTPTATKACRCYPREKWAPYSSFKLVHNREFDADIISKQDIP